MIKQIIYRLLCNNITGNLLHFFFPKNIPDIRWKGFAFNINDSGMLKQHVASIFWGFYESAEIRFIEKYVDGKMDVIELGASSGIVSAHIVRKLNPSAKMICVEGNSNLANTWK